MADFLTAYKACMKIEGGYANVAEDSGGETWKGVARNKHPSWAGWAIVDACRSQPGFPDNLYQQPPLQELVLSFYRIQFWDRMRGDEIRKQSIANALFDNCVNVGCPVGIKLAQVAAFGLKSDDDEERKKQALKMGISYGYMDSKTLKKLNNA